MAGEPYPVLNRIPHFDERSREFSVRKLIGPAEYIQKRKRVWKAMLPVPLDQGREGACVGFSWASELAATPKPFKTDNEFARDLYNLSRVEDRAMGNHWPEGASVLAGAKATKRLELLTTYYWAFGIEDVIDCLVKKGPLVVGINWYESMYRTDPDGRVLISGRVVGGHAIMVHGYWPRHSKFGDCFVWTNSWGPSYGINGRGFIRVEDLARLLGEQGEACIPTDAPLRKE